MVARKVAEEGLYEYIDATADVQRETSDLVLKAGVAGLKVLYSDGHFSMPVILSILTSTGMHRGVHMSRLVAAASLARPRGIEAWLRSICREVNRTQPGTEVTCSFEFPHDDQFAKVVVRTTEQGRATYQHTVSGMTACPCSKKMIGVGHMQRAEIALATKGRNHPDSSIVISRIGECFSALPKEKMKRLEEAKRIMEAQANPRFAEDLVRECVKRFPNALFVSARCFESIHVHDAVATWTAKPGWMPLV